MKIFHTGDWHIGKIINQVYMTKDQEHILQELITLIEKEKPDVLLISGDVYDRAIPPVEAVELLDRTLSRIVLDLATPVILIAGNHDSPDRLGFGSGILKARGMHVAGPLREEISSLTLTDEYGPVHFYLVPYASNSVIRDVLDQQDIQDTNSAIKAVIERIKSNWNPAERNVLVTHGFFQGGEEPELSESEKPLSYTDSIGGVDGVAAALVGDFDYVALGHLHCPQRVGSERIRYAGSLLKYSFSEVNQKKSVTVVSLQEKGNVAVECKALSPIRDMKKIKGSLRELLEPGFYNEINIEDYFQVTLTDEIGIADPMGKLRVVYPNVLTLDFEKRGNFDGIVKNSAGADCKTKTKLDLFAEFYTDITGREFSEGKKLIMAGVIDDVEKGERMA